jgi:hypothetical protein
MFKYNPNLVEQCEGVICEFSLSFDESTCSLVEGSVFRNSDCIIRKGCPKSEPKYGLLGLLVILLPVGILAILIGSCMLYQRYCRNDSHKKGKGQEHPASKDTTPTKDTTGSNNSDYDEPDGPGLKGIRRRLHN